MKELEMLFEDQAFMEKMAGCTSIAEIVKLLAENGIEMTEDEVKEMIVEASAPALSGELNEDDLENVSGGWGFRIGNPFKKLGEWLGKKQFDYWDNLINSYLK